MDILTSDQIIATVNAMRMDETHKAILIKQALSGNPGARFVVYNAWKRGTEVPPYATRKALRDATLSVGRDAS
jgi:hypothetical protein